MSYASVIEAAVKAERERCAKIAEGLSSKPGWSPGYKRAAEMIANMIRRDHEQNVQETK